jgi:hypothetical protein
MSRGNVTVTWRADEWMESAVPALNKGLTAAAARGADQAVRNFGTEGGGVKGADLSPLAGGKRTNRKKKKGKARYTASPPGSFPGVRTSQLRNSVRFVSPDSMGTPLRSAIGTALKYGRWLELGTSKYPTMQRPWLIRSVMMSKERMRKAFINTAKRELMAAGLVREQ